MEQLQRIETLEKRYYELSVQLERLSENEKHHDFTIRDSAVKVGIAEGLAETNFKEISQLRLEMHQLRAEMKELRQSNDQQFEAVHEKLDRQENLLRQVLEKLQ